jgi:hypothetical protein
MAVQMNYIGSGQVVEFDILGARGRVKEVLFGDVRTRENGSPSFVMGRTSVAAVILSYKKPPEEGELALPHLLGVQLPVSVVS